MGNSGLAAKPFIVETGAQNYDSGSNLDKMIFLWEQKSTYLAIGKFKFS